MKFWSYYKNFFKKPIKTIIKDIVDPIKFPCEDCLILPLGCKQLCNRVEMDPKKMKDLMFRAGEKDGGLHCPDCGCTEWYDGPAGGLSVNCKCGRCGHWFNLAPQLMGFERIHLTADLKVYD